MRAKAAPWLIGQCNACTSLAATELLDSAFGRFKTIQSDSNAIGTAGS